MKLVIPSPEIAPYGLRAMIMIAKAAEDDLGISHIALLSATQKVLLQTNIDIEQVETITPEELSSYFTDPALCRQLIQEMVVMSLVDAPAKEKQTELISVYAKALNGDEPAVDVIRHLAKKKFFNVSFRFLSSLSFMNSYGVTI